MFTNTLFHILLVLTTASISHSQPSKCDQTPPGAVYKEPRDDKHPFRLIIENNSEKQDDNVNYFTADQTYVLSLATTTSNRTFRWFMITAEDPDVDNAVNNRQQAKDVGSLKTLDILQSRHSERCANSVENFDNTDKFKVEVHWVSPHETDRVRIRAMVAENDEVWYEGENLNIILVKEESPARDSSPNPPVRHCNICGEARYEVIFKGLWSRVAHPQHYPTKPDENGYTHMVGASHDFDYYLWKAGTKAREGLKVLLETANTRDLEREIISAMSETSGTRTLIRGKRRHHPYMFKDSHSLFRVDRIHHLFSVVVGMRPSPDWFLGMTQFELCVNDEWLKEYEVPLYPWDAGTRSGVSYESETAPTQDNIERVEVGSFNTESPFYQKNLNDLKPFAKLLVRRLDVYPWDESECAELNGEQDNPDQEEEPSDEPQPYPILSESRQKLDSRMSRCYLGEWGEWTACVPDVGEYGLGARSRTRQRLRTRTTGYSAPEVYYADEDNSDDSNYCQVDGGDSNLIEIQHCFVE